MLDADDLADRRRLLPTTLADQLRTEILTGALAPGSRLRQAEVAARFQVSTTPVREAFVMLERDGFVRSVAHRGVVVFLPSVRDLREVYEMRIALEALAAELAVPNLSSADLVALGETLAELNEANRRGDRKKSQELNDAFHNRIYSACDRPRLTSLVIDLRRTSLGYRRVFTDIVFSTEHSGLDRTEEEHANIYEACSARAPQKAAKATTQHLQHTLRVVDAYLKTQEAPENMKQSA